jgi:hypothetical protein
MVSVPNPALLFVSRFIALSPADLLTVIDPHARSKPCSTEDLDMLEFLSQHGLIDTAQFVNRHKSGAAFDSSQGIPYHTGTGLKAPVLPSLGNTFRNLNSQPRQTQASGQ